MRGGDLQALVGGARALFREFRTLDLKSLSEADVQEFVNQHRLTEDDLLGDRFSKETGGVVDGELSSGPRV